MDPEKMAHPRLKKSRYVSKNSSLKFEIDFEDFKVEIEGKGIPRTTTSLQGTKVIGIFCIKLCFLKLDFSTSVKAIKSL